MKNESNFFRDIDSPNKAKLLSLTQFLTHVEHNLTLHISGKQYIRGIHNTHHIFQTL